MSYLSENQTKKERAALARDFVRARHAWKYAFDQAMNGSPDREVLANAMLLMNAVDFRAVQMGHGDMVECKKSYIGEKNAKIV